MGARVSGSGGRGRGPQVHDRCVSIESPQKADMEPVRFGLVGYGFGGRYFHAPLLTAAPEVDLLGVVTTSAERRAQVAAEHPGLRTFGSLEELAAAGAEAVAISTPADTHTPLSEQ